MHGFGDHFTVGNSLDHGTGAVDGVAGGEDAGTAGMALIVGLQQAIDKV